jgi:hypothetical protein
VDVEARLTAGFIEAVRSSRTARRQLQALGLLTVVVGPH